MKNRVQYKKKTKIRNSLSRRNYDSTRKLQLVQNAVFDESDNANSMGMLSPCKCI